MKKSIIILCFLFFLGFSHFGFSQIKISALPTLPVDSSLVGNWLVIARDGGTYKLLTDSILANVVVTQDTIVLNQIDSILNVRCHDTSFQIYPNTGALSYNNPGLVNKSIYLLIRNRIEEMPNSDYGYNWSTGTILFASAVGTSESFLIHTGCYPDSVGYSDPPPPPPPPDTIPIPPPPTDTTINGFFRIGAAIGGNWDATTKAAMILNLNGHYVRGNTQLSVYSGKDKQLESYMAGGVHPVWTVSWQGSGSSNRKFPNATVFKNAMRPFILKYKNYFTDTTGLLVIENEEDNHQYFDDSRLNYISQLSSAVDLADSLNIEVTNGGLHEPEIVYKVAKDFQTRGVTDSLAWWKTNNFTSAMNSAWNGNDNNFALRLRTFDTLFNAYAAMPKLTYINVHIKDNANEAQRVNTLFVKYISKWVYDHSGKRMVTNETAQQNSESATIIHNLILAFYNNKTPYVILFSVNSVCCGGRNYYDESITTPTLTAQGIEVKNTIAGLP